MTPEETLRQLAEDISNAIRTRQVEPVLAVLDEEVILTVMTGEVCRGRQAVADYFARMLTGPGHLLRHMDVRMTLNGPPRRLSEDVVLAIGRSNTTYEFVTGHTLKVQNHLTTVMVFRDTWRIAALQWSANVLDNPILTGARRAAWWTGVSGLTLGAWIGWRLSQR